MWDAHQLNGRTERRLALAEQELERQRGLTQQMLEKLGHTELTIYDTVVRRFAVIFEEMKNVELTELASEQAPPEIVDYDVSIRGIDFTAVDALTSAVVGGSAGATAGLISFAGVGTFASASTGTAIGSLGGAAATNATLAWFGGGSLAAGGAGMAGGVAVLGGLVVVPVLAVGGFVLHTKGKQALARARTDEREAGRAIAEMKLAREVAGQIAGRASRVCDLLERLAAPADERVAALEDLVERDADYATYDERDREQVRATVTLVKTLRALMDVPLITGDGALHPEAPSAINAASRVVRDIETAA